MDLKKSIAAAIAVCVIFFFVCCRTPAVNNWEIDQGPGFTKVVFFGDSLTTGFGLKDKERSYPSQLAKKLNLPKIVYGFNGYTTGDALKVIDRLKTEKPGLLVLTIGGNDILRKKNLNETEKNLRTIISTLKGMGHTVVFTEVLSFFDGKRHEMYRRVCTELKIAMVPDILAGLLKDTEAMQADTIHPDVKGCEIIATKVAAVITQFHGAD